MTTDRETLEERVKRLEDQREQDQKEKEQLRNEVKELQNEVEDLRERVDENEEEQSEINELKQEVNELREENEELRDEIKSQTEEIDDLDRVIDEVSNLAGKRRAQMSQTISGIKEKVEGIDVAGSSSPTDEETIQASELTPIEQLSRAEDVSEVTDSPTVQRAVSLFKNITDWGAKTTKGYVLTAKDNPVSLLEADQDETLAWKQYYRAADTLESLSHGSVTYFDHEEHGKTICLHEESEAYERVVNGSLTASSVGVEG